MNWVKIVNFVRAAHQKSAGASFKVQGGKRMTQGNSRGQTVVGAGGDKDVYTGKSPRGAFLSLSRR